MDAEIPVRRPAGWMFMLAGLAIIACGNVQAMSFTDVSADAGFMPAHDTNLPSGGIAVADFDGNGWPDIFVTGYFEPNRMYFNQGDGTFVQDSTINAQLAGTDCTVSAAADYDNDGWPDLYVGCHFAPNHLFRNNQGQSFSDVTPAALQHNPPGSPVARTDAVAWGDLDRNGLLDLFLGAYPASSAPDPAEPANHDRIMLQNADGTWTDAAAGLNTDLLSRQALAATFSDIDRDGDTDLYVINDKDTGNVLWRNDGPGCGSVCLVDAAPASGADRPVNGMGIAIGDIQHDGIWDLYFSDVDEQVLMLGTSLDPLTFVEHSNPAGVSIFAVGWATIFTDFDNDRFEDAFLAIGYGNMVNPNHDRWYRNLGDTTFEHVTDPGDMALDHTSESAARIDYDRDGRMDLVVGRRFEDYRLYRNITQDPGNWLGLELTGGFRINADAVGAVVEITDSDGVTQVREVRAGESRGASHDRIVHFGLGDETGADVTVHWPNGTVQSLGTLAAGQYHRIAYPVIFRDQFD